MEALQVAAKLNPDTGAFLMVTEHAVVFFFRGSEPLRGSEPFNLMTIKIAYGDSSHDAVIHLY